ncbi:MAG: hypothetical protein EB127_25125, partial [Alphaproteobacteria bacterium]|nr:hypothetical protein [Alphaproteobacteria bacterium]
SANKATDMAQDFDTDAVYLTNYSDLKHDVHGRFDELYMAKHLRSVQHYPLLLAIRNYSDPKVFNPSIRRLMIQSIWVWFLLE